MKERAYGKVVGFRAEDALLCKLESDGRKLGVSRSDVIRQIIIRHYAKASTRQSIGL